MITAKNVKELIRLKEKDRKAFYKLLEEMHKASPLDVLLTFKKFKEYAPNV